MNIVNRLLMIISIFSIMLIIPININDTTIYATTIFEIIVVLIISLYKLKFNKKEKILGIFILFYSFTSIFNLFFMENKYIIYTLNKLIPIICMYLLIGYYNNHKLNIEKLINCVQLLFNIIIIGSFIMFLLGYSSIKMENGFIHFVPNQFFYNTYNEPRLSWIFTHKSRFAIVCFLNIGLLMKNKNLKKSKKYILIFISLIDIYFSSSKTILIISFIILLNNYMKNNLNEKKQKFLKYSLITLAIPIICLLVPKVISKLSESRDVNSLGGRVYIWEAGIHKSVNDFWGIGRFDSLNWITTDKLPGGLYTHAHNMYINEMIERGIIPGIIFTLIFVYMIFMFKNSLNRYILIGCFLSSMMDNILTSEISYIFWLMMFINYEYEKYYYNKNKVEIYEKGLSNRPKP